MLNARTVPSTRICDVALLKISFMRYLEKVWAPLSVYPQNRLAAPCPAFCACSLSRAHAPNCQSRAHAHIQAGTCPHLHGACCNQLGTNWSFERSPASDMCGPGADVGQWLAAGGLKHRREHCVAEAAQCGVGPAIHVGLILQPYVRPLVPNGTDKRVCVRVYV